MASSFYQAAGGTSNIWKEIVSEAPISKPKQSCTLAVKVAIYLETTDNLLMSWVTDEYFGMAGSWWHPADQALILIVLI